MSKRLTLCAVFLMITITAYGGAPQQGRDVSTSVRRYRQAHQQEILKEFIQLLSVPNVASDHPNIRKNAQLIKHMMSARGIKTEIMETEGNPVICGELKVPGARRTLMFYVHYDGQPVNPEKWIDSEPFSPALRPGKLEAGTDLPRPIPIPDSGAALEDNWRLYGRSTSDDKAPIIAILSALDALKEEGIPLKNNLKFILDGEEEAGSPNLLPFIRENRDLLKADVLFMCDGPTYYSGDPTLFFGVRGIVGMKITVYGPNVNLHSGHFGNWAPNPAWMLARLLASMRDSEGRVQIEGFYDTVAPLSKGEKEALGAIPPFENDLKSLYGFTGQDELSESLMEAIQLPSLNINGMISGWAGEQSRTIIPSEAWVSLDIRLVKGNDPADMIEKVAAHIRKQGYHIVDEEPDLETRMKYGRIARIEGEKGGYPASRFSMDHPISRGAIEALSGGSSGRLILLPTLGGSLPIHPFSRILEVPVIGLPVVNHDNNQHQANENIRLGHLWTAVETFALIFGMQWE
jgi:acetylornithine deacetylase/succinyl-diaminopimelate desuccinylase-like protein